MPTGQAALQSLLKHNDPFTLTLPEVVKVVAVMFEAVTSARVVEPVTFRVDKVVAPVTAKVEPTVVAPLKVVAPETAKVPMAIESFKAKVPDPPNRISPPPVKLVPAVMVILALVKAVAGILVMVLLEPLIVLLVIV